MNVINNYTRNDTTLIEGLSLNDNEQLVPKLASNEYREGNPVDTYKIREQQDIPNYDLTTNWTLYPIGIKNLLRGDGTYVIQIRYGSVIYSGIFSFCDNSNIEEEILLHAAGTYKRTDLNDNNEGRLFAKIGINNNIPELYLASSIKELNVNSHIHIKFRKLI